MRIGKDCPPDGPLLVDDHSIEAALGIVKESQSHCRYLYVAFVKESDLSI